MRKILYIQVLRQEIPALIQWLRVTRYPDYFHFWALPPLDYLIFAPRLLQDGTAINTWITYLYHNDQRLEKTTLSSIENTTMAEGEWH